jgi:hypothetical protein
MDENPYRAPQHAVGSDRVNAGRKRYQPVRGAALGALAGLASIPIATRLSPGASLPPPEAFLEPGLLLVTLGLVGGGAIIGWLSLAAANRFGVRR